MNSKYKKIAFLQMILMISMTFAIAFSINASFVSSADETVFQDGLFRPATAPATSSESAFVTPQQGSLSLGGAPSTLPVQSQTAGGILTGAGAEAVTNPITAESILGGKTYSIGGYLDTGIGGAQGILLQGLVWAGVAYFAAKMLGNLVGLSDKNSNAAGLALAAGAFTFKGIQALQVAQNFGGTAGSSFAPGGFFNSGLFANPILPAIGVALVVFVLLYKKETKKLVTFQCLPFEPPIGGAKCEECNKDPFRPCSEYRCRALGQACQLLNKEDPAKAACAWINPKDVNTPTITPWTDVLSPQNLKYISDTSIRPPALGVKIVKDQNGCIPAFTPLRFGLLTNEPAQCKIDYNHTATFDSMQYFFGDSNLYEYNHTQVMRLPAPTNSPNATDNAPLLKNDGTFSLYARCRDANGNANVDEYAISFCVDQGPDTTPPIIEKTSIISGSPVQAGVDTVPIQVYTNEPAECKWSSQSKAFSDMENGMTCDSETFQVNGDLLYTCSGNLTSVKDTSLNHFYFRCKDQPNEAEEKRNTNVQSYELILRGSKELNILSITPNETIYGSTSTVPVDLQVETSNGADEGKALCYFSNNQNLDSFIPMFETNSFKHKQTLSLTPGDYNYYVRCIDAGGNTDLASTAFTVVVDKQAPVVTRIYREGTDALKVVTNEDAECSYSLTTCNFNFDEGIKMIYNPPTNKQAMFSEWKPSAVYYIKCRDSYRNEPSPNACSIVGSAVQLKADIK